jgi:hypothetical protein
MCPILSAPGACPTVGGCPPQSLACQPGGGPAGGPEAALAAPVTLAGCQPLSVACPPTPVLHCPTPQAPCVSHHFNCPSIVLLCVTQHQQQCQVASVLCPPTPFCPRTPFCPPTPFCPITLACPMQTLACQVQSLACGGGFPGGG